MGKKIEKKKSVSKTRTLTILPTEGITSKLANLALLLMMFSGVVLMGIIILDLVKEIHITMGPVK